MTQVIKYSDGSIEYKWDGFESDWEKEAIREYGVEQASEIDTALAWREAIDKMDDQQAARALRGKHPTKDAEIGRLRTPGNRPDSTSQ